MSSVLSIEKKGGEEWIRSLRKKDLKEVRDELIQLKGVGRKVADCIALFSMDCPSCVPVDTHVFQIAKKFGFLKGSSKTTNVSEKVYHEINDAFLAKYGEEAGWAH